MGSVLGLKLGAKQPILLSKALDLDLTLLRARAVELGLDEATLAARCETDAASVGRWLSGQSVPRPKHLLRLLLTLGLSWEAVFGPTQPPGEVRFFDSAEALTPCEGQEDAVESCVWALRTLSQYLEGPAPLTSEQVAAMVKALTEKEPPLPRAQLLPLLQGLGVAVVPSPAMGAGGKVSRSFAVHFKDRDHRFLVLDLALGAKAGLLEHTLMQACGYFLTRHPLAGAERQGLEAWLVDFPVSRVAPGSEVSDPAYAAQFTASSLDAQQLVERSEAYFGPQVFQAVRDYQKDNGGRDHAFVASTFCVGILDGYELSAALMPGLDWAKVQAACKERAQAASQGR